MLCALIIFVSFDMEFRLGSILMVVMLIFLVWVIEIWLLRWLRRTNEKSQLCK